MSEKPFETDTLVSWEWGQGTAEGRVEKSYTQKATRTIKGTKVTRNADKENPAYLIKQDDGDEVLKSHSELSKK